MKIVDVFFFSPAMRFSASDEFYLYREQNEQHTKILLIETHIIMINVFGRAILRKMMQAQRAIERCVLPMCTN